MADTAVRDKERQETDDAQRRETELARHDLEAGLETGEEAIAQLAQGWADAFRSFVPGVWLRPAQAIDLTFDLFQQQLVLQRRLLQELLGVTREQLERNDAGRWDSNDWNGETARTTNGGMTTARAGAGV